MDKYEQRRLRLIEVRDRFCNGKTSELVRRIEGEPSYIFRTLYPERKSGKKCITDDMMELIEKSFNLPRRWMDMLADGKAGAIDHPEFMGNVHMGFVPVVGEAALGVDDSVNMTEFRSGWLNIYSSDKDAYDLEVEGGSIWSRVQPGEYIVIEPSTSVHPGDEVFVRTKDGHSMIKIMGKTRDGDYQSSSIDSDHRPVILPAEGANKMRFTSAIVKHTRYVDQDDLPKA